MEERLKGVLKERLTGGDEITGLEFDEWGIVRSQAWFYGTLRATSIDYRMTWE